MKKLSVKWKIMLPVYLVIVVFIIGMCIQFQFLNQASERVTVMHNQYFLATTKSAELKLDIVQIQQWLTDVSVTHEKDGFETAKDYADKSRALLTELKALCPEEASLLEQIERDFEPYYSAGVEMAETYLSQGQSAGNRMMDNFDQSAAALDKSMSSYLDTLSVAVEASVKAIHSSINRSILFVIILVIVSFFLTGFVFVTATRLIIKPIRGIGTMAGELGKGNLTITNKCTQTDEIGELAIEVSRTADTLNRYIREIGVYLKELENGNLSATLDEAFSGDFIALKDSLKTLGDSLNEMVEQIQISSDAVANGAEQVAVGAQSLATGSAEQASSIDQLQTTITTTSDNILLAAQRAQNANTRVNSVGSAAQTSNQQMHEMIAAMDKISQSSHEIGKIIKTIEDIAFQTNILALNAAVEAARAGEAGKGFAVVADEVRNLASKSAEAAQNTTTLIEDSISAVENGVGIANETAESLNMVVGGVQDVVQSISEISDVLQQQTSEIENIKASIGEISGVTQTISSTAEENGEASRVLSDQSDRLKELLHRFRLK